VEAEKVPAMLSMMSLSTMVDGGVVCSSLVSVSEKDVVREVRHALEQLGEEEGSKGLIGGGGFDEKSVVLLTMRWRKAKMWVARLFSGEVILGRNRQSATTH
jgi:hypothetical protein